MKDRQSKYLRNPVYYLSRVFLQENHPYSREPSSFNAKPERTEMPEIMTSTDWLRENDRDKDKEIDDMFDSNGQPIFDDPEFFDTYVEKIPKGVKTISIFY